MLYAFLSLVVFIIVFPVLLFHPKLKGGLRERLGFCEFAVLKCGGRPAATVWFHAASAGDILSVKPIVEGVKKSLPDAAIVVSTITNSGMDMARKKLAGTADKIMYTPFDVLPAVALTCGRIGPNLLVLEYTEIWPNLLRAVRRRGAAVILVNGRFSPRRFPNYRLLFRVTGNLMREIDLFLMRGQSEAGRAIALGAPEDRVIVTGNTKFDSLPLGEDHASLRRLLRRQMKIAAEARVVMAGSTHESEDAMLVDAYRGLLDGFPELKLVIAPRYTERVAAILKIAAERKLAAATRTKPSPEAQVTVVDTMGELATLYCVADVAVVGGSFVTRGGQNMLEPAACGVPVLFGPHIENFEDAFEILQGRGGIKVKDSSSLQALLGTLLRQPERARELGMMAYEAVLGTAGAAEKNVGLIIDFLMKRRAGAASNTG